MNTFKKFAYEALLPAGIMLTLAFTFICAMKYLINDPKLETPIVVIQKTVIAFPTECNYRLQANNSENVQFIEHCDFANSGDTLKIH